MTFMVFTSAVHSQAGIAVVESARGPALPNLRSTLHRDDVDPKSIKIVNAVFMNHLDVGFDGIDPIPGFAVNVVNKYFDVYYPQAVAVSRRLRAEGRSERLVYTTHSWMASMYVDCPPGMGIHCPTEEQRAAFLDTVRVGDIVWHAFPFNTEPETLDEPMVNFALEMTHDLDDLTGRPRATVMSQRDVPGMTRAIIPVLRKHGIVGISVGVNGASMPPAVPPVFVWEDKSSNESVMVTYHPGGYGGVFALPGFDHCLYFNFREDNQGPPSYDEVLQNYQTMRELYPNAKIVAGPMDNFYTALVSIKDQLPVVSGEIGDTWIYGVPSDPLKNALVRTMMRERSSYLTVDNAQNDYSFKNFSRLLLKASEHTWGGDVKTFLDADHSDLYYQWSNEAFDKIKDSSSAYKGLVGTWHEQRAWAIDFAMEALSIGDGHTPHPLYAPLSAKLKEFMATQSTLPATAGFEEVGPAELRGRIFDLRTLQLGLDPATGAIVHLTDATGSANLARDDKPLGEVVYQTFSGDDYVDFLKSYMYCDFVKDCHWAMLDFGKANVTQYAAPKHQEARPSVEKVFYKGTQVIVELSFAEDLVRTYGAPPSVVVEYGSTASGLQITYRTVGKRPTRLPEALWVRFNPDLLGETESHFVLNKIGSAVLHDDMVKNGSFHLHAVTDSGVSVPYANHKFDLHIESTDAPVVTLGHPNPFPTPTNQSPRVEDGLAFNLVNNIWGTNYVMWYPFSPADSVSMFRFNLSVTPRK